MGDLWFGTLGGGRGRRGHVWSGERGGGQGGDDLAPGSTSVWCVWGGTWGGNLDPPVLGMCVCVSVCVCVCEGGGTWIHQCLVFVCVCVCVRGGGGYLDQCLQYEALLRLCSTSASTDSGAA